MVAFGGRAEETEESDDSDSDRDGGRHSKDFDGDDFRSALFEDYDSAEESNDSSGSSDELHQDPYSGYVTGSRRSGATPRRVWLDINEVRLQERGFMVKQLEARARHEGFDHEDHLPGGRTMSERSSHSVSELQPRFSLAFSGGGVRAASFQAGVLWRLAEAGRLKDVDYWAAVSGGSYIAAAFASHLVEAGKPTESEDVDRWYLGVVARTLHRMQHNMPYLVRDMGKRPFEWPKDGSSFLPRIFDLPILVVVFAYNMVAVIFLWGLLIVVPMLEVLDSVLGSDMRWAFCHDIQERPSQMIWSAYDSIFGLQAMAKDPYCLALLVGGIIVSFLLWLYTAAQKPPPSTRKGPQARVQEGRGPRLTLWLVGSSTLFVFVRGVQAVVCLFIVIGFATICQEWEHQLLFAKDQGVLRLSGSNFLDHGYVPELNQQTLNRTCLCYKYLHQVEDSPTCTDKWATKPRKPSVEALYNLTGCLEEIKNETVVNPYMWCGGTEYKGPEVRCPEGFACQATGKSDGIIYVKQCMPDTRKGKEGSEDKVDQEQGWFEKNVLSDPLRAFCVIIPTSLLGSVLLIPFFPKMWAKIIAFVGPFAAFLIVGVLIQSRIYGVKGLGKRELLSTDNLIGFLIAAMVITPFTHTLKGTMHRFYRWSLQRAFFCRGLDKTWRDLGKNPYCPFLIFNATITDFILPDAKIPLNEISFSPLHIGGVATGYLRAFKSRSLSRSVALSGAAIDAFILGKKDQRKYRFWMEFLSLNMGDFMIFNPERHRWILHQEETGWALDSAHLWLRLPSVLFQELVYGLMVASLHASNHQHCDASRYLSYASAALGCAMVIGSFFGFLHHLDFLLNSVALRGIHQVLQFYHRDARPPTLVHITDGGLLDNTGVMQLMRRRVERILLVYGGNDPKEQFKYLKKLADSLASEKIGSLHDPVDPRRDLRETYQSFRENKEAPYLHLRVKYGWCCDRTQTETKNLSGDLFIVMSRLSPQNHDITVKPLLTEQTILSGEAAQEKFVSEMENPMLQRHLGGCMCDCCHSHGCNFGRKFPSPPNANQFLTPQLFNSLCRLGHDISGAAVQALSTPLGADVADLVDGLLVGTRSSLPARPDLQPLLPSVSGESLGPPRRE